MVKQDRTFIDAVKNYFPSDIKDDEKHDTEVESMFYLEKLKHLLVMERDSKKFKVYNSKTGKLIRTVPKENQYGGAVIAADYIEIENTNTKYVATTSNNNTINFWDCTNNYSYKERINTSDIQMCIKWCGESVNKLFTAGICKKIHAYDVNKLIEIPMKHEEDQNETDRNKSRKELAGDDDDDFRREGDRG